MVPNSQLVLSTSELIAEKIRNSIIFGEYKSGQALKQDVLAEELNVSKIPIREALNQLKSEGLVSFLNNRGSVVSSLSVKEVEEIYTMRMALEEMALKKSIPYLQPANTITAESTLRLIDESRDPLDWARLNWRFHASLYEAAEMPILLETVSRLHNNVARYMVLYLDEMKYQDVSQKEHWDLLDACRQKKTRRAISILRSHLKDAMEQTIYYMQMGS